jgi:hypothetical protein
MAAKLPDGSILAIATVLASTKPITTLSNGAPGAVGSVGHGYSNSDALLLASGWQKLDNRVFQVAGQTTDAYNLSGTDTTDTTKYPAGSGVGTTRKITTWQQISQILGFSTSGGDQQFTNFSYLEDDFERQLPTVTSAQSLQLDIADDASLAGYVALKAASESKANSVMRLILPGGSLIYYVGIVSLNETPTVTKGSVMAVRASFSLQSRPTRY